MTEAHEAEDEVPIAHEVARRLDLITNTPGAVLKYDGNGDGVLDAEEWEVLRSLVEAQVVRERESDEHEDDEDDDEDDHPWSIEEELEDPHVDLPVLEVLDQRYEVLRELGRGSQGTTLLARRREDQHYVAVKELAFDRLESWKSLELFEREAEVLRGLDHERIPAFVDAFSVDDDGATRFFLVQTFVSGSSLDVLLAERQRLSERDVLDFAANVLSVLDYLHTCVPPVIHRDVKPSNLIRQPDGTYALVDFGGAQVVLPSDIGGSTIIGTTGYMPPEQLTGRASPQSDLYALGATMVHLVTHVSPSQLPTKRLKLDWRERAGISAPLADFIDRLIEPIVEDRYPTAADALRKIHVLRDSVTALAVRPETARSDSTHQLERRTSAFLQSPASAGRAVGRKRVENGVLIFDVGSRGMPVMLYSTVLALLFILVMGFARGLPGYAIVVVGALAAAGLTYAFGGDAPAAEELRIWPNGRFVLTRADPQGETEQGKIANVRPDGDVLLIETDDDRRVELAREVPRPEQEWISADIQRELGSVEAEKNRRP